MDSKLIIKLKEHLVSLYESLYLISDSFHNFQNKEEQNIIETVFNGETEKGVARDKYTALFRYSFDDEVASLWEFLEEFLNDDIRVSTFEQHENIETILLGFETVKKALEDLNNLVNVHKNLKVKLLSFERTGEFHNPIKQYLDSQFIENFKDWSVTFELEIQEELGKRAF